MGVLKNLVALLTPYAKDAVPVSETEIRQFAKEHEILLREDYVHFMMRFGCEPLGRLHIFKMYEGNFGFQSLKAVCLENSPEMKPPIGYTYFGSSFLGDSFCIDYESGKIYVYDEEERYGLVHEGIDGFLLRCLLVTYIQDAFAEKAVNRDLDMAYIDKFRLVNEKHKIAGATTYEMEYEHTDTPKVLGEYYFIDGKLAALYPPTRTLVMLSGGVLENLKL